MATTTNSKRLTMIFGTETEGDQSIGISIVKDNLTAAEVKTAMDTIVTNGSAFEFPLTSAISAELKSTDTTKLVVDGAAVE